MKLKPFYAVSAIVAVIALVSSPSDAFKFKDEDTAASSQALPTKVDEAAAYFGLESDSDDHQKAAPRDPRKIPGSAPRDPRKIPGSAAASVPKETVVEAQPAQAAVKESQEAAEPAVADKTEQVEGRFFDIKGKLCALGLSNVRMTPKYFLRCTKICTLIA